MRVKKLFDFNTSSGSSKRHVDYEEPSHCPICKYALKPLELRNATYQDESGCWHVSMLYLCKHCYQVFMTSHICKLEVGSHQSSATFSTELECLAPVKFEELKFDESIEALSPKFVKIYNQALAADSSSLDEIAGLGYRKALEFLIKDFCIHLHPDDTEKIQKCPLSRCISEYIDSPDIKTLATRATWLGNDEAHYVRKFEDRDITDMKRFIKAAVYFIGMVLITEDAHGMDPA